MNRYWRFPLLAILSFWLCGLTAIAQAQSGNSIPFFDGDSQTLVIPRIDVEGYGSLKITLLLEDEIDLTFSVLEAIPADPGSSPGATYDLDSALLAIPLAQADFQFYDLQLQLTPGDLFQLSSAVESSLPGQENYNNQCASCHGIDGQGGAVTVSMINCANCEDIDKLATYIENVMPLGASDNCTADCASDVASYIQTVFQVDNSPMVSQTLAALQTQSLDDSLRKASLQLVSRLPTEAEIELLASDGEDGFRQVLDGMMTEQAFYDRLAEIFNDLFLTDRYLQANSRPGEALNLMRPFPDAYWFDPGEDYRDAEFLSTLQITNDSVAREPLQLINYVVRNELPMTEILTADYFMVNPYSAKSYGVFDELAFNDEWDADEWLPAQLSLYQVPHAGLLSSFMFLNRYPTSETNRNRARSRVVYDLFLDVDILALEGSRPDGEAVDISSPAPTMDNDDCVVCHELLDPVASSFENWSQRGFYMPNLPWYDDMFQAGFAGIDRPAEEESTSLQWLASQMQTDPRFNDAMVRIVYRGLTGREPLDPPGETGTEAQWDAYNAESVHLDELKAAFVADNQNLKTLIKEVILSPYWAASGLNDEGFALIHEETGAARLLPPEQLHRRIDALLGFEWRSALDFYSIAKDIPSQARLLDDRNYYHQIYGGIDSFVVTERLEDPNGLMVAVQERMANELACYAVANDFLAQADERLLFPLVEADMQPLGSSNQSAIRDNIRHLHEHLLGESLSLDAAEIDSSYALFEDVWSNGKAAIGSTESEQLPPLCRRTRDLISGELLAQPISDDPDYVLRAWMAVTAYLLSDYRFVYE
jgi:mono/diheme cytochrome c family protein